MPETRGEEYDVIVAGGGLAGLTSAALLSKEGLRVVLLEKNLRLGGYGTSYTAHGHRFDIAIQAIGGCEEGGIIPQVLSELGCEENIRCIPCDPARAYYFEGSDTPWLQAGSWRGVAQSLTSRYPESRNKIEKCFEIWTGILQELSRISTGKNDPAAAFTFPRSYPLLARYGDYTLEKFFDEIGIAREPRSLLAARSGYCMLEPHRLSLVGFACTEMTYGQGAWMVEGGIVRLGKALSKALLDSGGWIERNSEVISILTHRGRIKGVRTTTGRTYLGGRVIAAFAARHALEDCLDKPALLSERYRGKLQGMEATGSYYISYYRVPSEAVEGLYHNSEIRCLSKPLLAGWSPDTYYMLIPSLLDASAAPAGSHCLCLSVPCPAGLGPLIKEKNIIRSYLEGAVEERFPVVKGKLDFLFDLCPENLRAISGNPGGSAYGWAQLPDQSGIKRLNIKTPVPGLFLTGHWTMPGGGIAGVMTSGLLSAKAVMS